MCFYCRSFCGCPKCVQCPKCCTCSAGRRPSATLLADMVPPGCKSKGSVNLDGQLHSPFQIRPPLVRDPLIVSGYANPLRNLYLKEAFYALIHKKAVERVRVGTSSLFQQAIHSTKTKSEMASNFESQCSEKNFGHKKIQNGDTRNNPNLPATRRMGGIAGFQRRLFPHPHTQKVTEISQVSLPEPDLSIPGPPIRPLNSSYGVHLRG